MLRQMRQPLPRDSTANRPALIVRRTPAHTRLDGGGLDQFAAAQFPRLDRLQLGLRGGEASALGGGLRRPCGFAFFGAAMVDP